VIGLWEIFGELSQVPFVVGAVVIDAFVDAEVLPVFDRLEGMAAVRALELQGGCNLFPVDKGLLADFAFELSTSATVIIDILMRCTAERADGIRRDIVGLAFLGFDWLYGLAVPKTVVFVPELPVLFDEGFDDGQLIGEELLVFGTVELVMGPLFERDVSADKKYQPADLLVLMLNDDE